MGAIHVLQISDLHFVAEAGERVYGEPSDDNLNAVLQAVSESGAPVDLALATGDLSEDASRASYRRLGRRLHDLGCPVYCIPGNHDVPRAMHRHLLRDTVRTTPVVDLEGWRIILLSSLWEGRAAGRLGPRQLGRLERNLGERAHSHVAIAVHHPPLGPCATPDCRLADAPALFAVLDRHPAVRVVVSGHVHTTFDHERKGVRYLGAPSTCVSFVHTNGQHRKGSDPPGARLLELRPDGTVETRVCRARLSN